MAEPLYRLVANDLRSKIESGELPKEQGGALPTEIDLREEYGASRNTVRDAIKWLTTLGLVETRPGQGIFVVEKVTPFVSTLTGDPLTDQTGGEEPVYLAEVAASWQQMWDPQGGSPGAAEFEASAAVALGAWRAKRFELPDYYLVLAPAHGSLTAPDLYLGPLRAARPHRVAVAGVAESAAQAANLLDALRSLEHGPWWPPLDELLDVARGFYAGGLAETQQLAT